MTLRQRREPLFTILHSAFSRPTSPLREPRHWLRNQIFRSFPVHSVIPSALDCSKALQTFLSLLLFLYLLRIQLNSFRNHIVPHLLSPLSKYNQTQNVFSCALDSLLLCVLSPLFVSIYLLLPHPHWVLSSCDRLYIYFLLYRVVPCLSFPCLFVFWYAILFESILPF
jgi:hypothetical protein